jgi:DHA2 family multidrug resistance protein
MRAQPVPGEPSARDPPMRTGGPLGRPWSLTWREAQVLTYADAFLAVAACFALATAMVPLMRRAAPRQAAPAEAH